jgi:hypothetical protein
MNSSIVDSVVALPYTIYTVLPLTNEFASFLTPFGIWDGLIILHLIWGIFYWRVCITDNILFKDLSLDLFISSFTSLDIHTLSRNSTSIEWLCWWNIGYTSVPAHSSRTAFIPPILRLVMRSPYQEWITPFCINLVRTSFDALTGERLYYTSLKFTASAKSRMVMWLKSSSVSFWSSSLEKSENVDFKYFQKSRIHCFSLAMTPFAPFSLARLSRSYWPPSPTNLACTSDAIRNSNLEPVIPWFFHL